MDASRGSVRPVWALLLGLAVLLIAWRPGPLMLEWIRDPVNATAVQAISATVQATGAIVLIWVTWVNVRVTRKISEATERQSEATERQAEVTTRAVELAQQQHRDLVRPVLQITLLGSGVDSEANTLRLRLQVVNAGNGPAFGVRAEISDTPLREEAGAGRIGSGTPALMRVGDLVRFDFASGGANEWPGPGKENQVVGGILLTCRDSFGGGRSTRADLVTRQRLKLKGVYRLELGPQQFDPDS